MKKNLYVMVVDDLHKAQKENDEVFVVNLGRIVQKIDSIKETFKKEITDEDVLVILKDVYINVNSECDESKKKKGSPTERVLSKIEDYFKKSNHEIFKYDNVRLSNGRKLQNVKTEIERLTEYSSGSNRIAGALTVIGAIIIILGFVAGIIFGIESGEVVATLTWLAYCGISGLLFIAFAEVIKLLHDIRRKLYE